MNNITISAQTCPACGTANPLEIVYGVPSAEMLDAVAAKVIWLGGEVADDASAAFACRSEKCDMQWGVIDWDD